VGLLLSLPAAAEDDVQFNRIETPAAVTRGTVSTVPQVREALRPGDVLRTGPGGRASLALAGGGSIMLAANTSVRVIRTAPPDPPGRTTRVELAIERGAVHVDARKLEHPAPADVHLVLQAMRVRLYGAEAWAEASPAGDELCLVSGAAEIGTLAGHRRLDEAGECLQVVGETVDRVPPSEIGSLAPRLAFTTFSDDYAARYAGMLAVRERTAKPRLAERAPPLPPNTVGTEVADASTTTEGEKPAGTETVAPVATAPAAPPPPPAVASKKAPPAKATASKAPASKAKTEWRLVLGSSGSRAQAEARAKELSKRGWRHVDVLEVPGETNLRFRVLAGRYATRADASTAQGKARQIADLKDAWIIEVPRKKR